MAAIGSVEMEPPERRFIRHALLTRWDPTHAAIAAELTQQPGFDWAAVLACAEQENLDPLLLDSIVESGWAPPDVLNRLQQHYVDTAFANTLFLHELRSLLSLLEAKQVAAIVLKGAALIESIYANAALRPMRDLDILVHPHDSVRAIDLLCAAGFALQDPEIMPGATLAFENEVMLVKQNPVPFILEIHWGLFDSPYYQAKLPIEWFWENSAPSAGPSAFRIFRAEAQLLHLCTHLALHHRGHGMLWQHDIVALLRQCPLDWPVVIKACRRCELVLAVRTTLHQLVAEWDAPIPTETLAAFDRLTPSQAEQRISARLTAPVRPVLRRFWDDLAEFPTWRQRRIFLWRNLFPTPAYMQQRYGSSSRWLLPALYPVRWLRGLWEWLTSAAVSMRGK